MRSLGYDGRDRLTSSWISGHGNESFGWDAFDRLRWRNSWSGAETFNYDGTHRLTSINGPTGTRWYGHDARGNVTGRPGFTHIFDAANRLTETPGVGRFEYDGHGRRTVTWRADGTAKVDFYTVDGKVRYKSDNREGGGTDYVYLGDQLVAEHKGPWRSARGTIYTHTDHLGTPVVRTNNLAHVYSRDRRTNFGAPLTLNPVEAEAGYTGHIEDPEQGLVYMQQRYYDPTIARFLSVDPVGPLSDPSNHFGRYHYALNNPYRYTDPDGRLPILIPAAIVAWRAYSAYDTATTIASSVGTLADANASATEKLIAGAELAGSLAGGKFGREASGDIAERAIDATRGTRRPTQTQREAALERSRGEDGVERCTYCDVELDRAPGKPNSAEIDHYDAYARGGETVDENLNAACRTCNREAGAKEKGTEWIPPNKREQSP
jgi:RHS repeat-associated protein